jgi:hypothetical protein
MALVLEVPIDTLLDGGVLGHAMGTMPSGVQSCFYVFGHELACKVLIFSIC